MRIICIGRNYGAHARELGNAIPEEPVIFLKPGTALIPAGGPILLPAFSDDIHHEIELVYKLERIGDAVRPSEVTVGLDLTARDLQQDLKAKGLPWEKAKAFDGSAYVSDRWITTQDPASGALRFGLKRNGSLVQAGTSSDMIFSVPDLIAHASRYFKLMSGDLLFTGTPAGVGRIAPGDLLEGYLQDEPYFHLRAEGPSR